MSAAVSEARRQRAVRAEPARIARALPIGAAVAVAGAVVLARPPRAVKGLEALLTRASTVRSTPAVAGAHETPDPRLQGHCHVALSVWRNHREAHLAARDLVLRSGQRASSLPLRVTLSIERQPAQGTSALGAGGSAVSTVARTSAISALAMRAALGASAKGAARRQPGEARRTCARPVEAETTRAAASDATALRAIGPAPPILALARVAHAAALVRAFVGAERNLARGPRVTARTAAAAVYASAVHPAARGWAHCGGAVLASPAIVTLAHAAW